MKAPACLRCETEMETGVIVDHTHGGQLQAEWAEGEPETNFWYGGLVLKGRTKHAIQTYRCPSCGYLESYAIDKAGS
jgi:hypothetical protein